MNALACLDPQTPLPLPKLMRATAQRPTTRTSVCDRLERRSLIHRQVNRHDRRSIPLELKERGRAVQQEVHAAYSRLASAAGSMTWPTLTNQVEAVFRSGGVVGDNAATTDRGESACETER